MPSKLTGYRNRPNPDTPGDHRKVPTGSRYSAIIGDDQPERLGVQPGSPATSRSRRTSRRFRTRCVATVGCAVEAPRRAARRPHLGGERAGTRQPLRLHAADRRGKSQWPVSWFSSSKDNEKNMKLFRDVSDRPAKNPARWQTTRVQSRSRTVSPSSIARRFALDAARRSLLGSSGAPTGAGSVFSEVRSLLSRRPLCSDRRFRSRVVVRYRKAVQWPSFLAGLSRSSSPTWRDRQGS